MAARKSVKLDVSAREPAGSRGARRLRASGRVPAVVYGGSDETIPVVADGRELRAALAAGGAVIDLSVDGADPGPVVLKDHDRHPVSGDTRHVDFLRVRLDRAIQAQTIIELVGAEEAPGVKEGGVLEQVTREITIEALPAAIPERIEHDVSAMEMNETITLDQVTAPEGVTLIGELEEIVVANLSPPRLELEEPEVEEETVLVGEDGQPLEGEELEAALAALEAEREAEGEGEAEPAEGGEAAAGEGAEGSDEGD